MFDPTPTSRLADQQIALGSMLGPAQQPGPGIGSPFAMGGVPSAFTGAPASPLGLVGAPSNIVSGIGSGLPDFIGQPLGLKGAASAPPVDKNYQRNLTTLTNKYSEMAQEIADLPEPIRNALMSYDTDRVVKGSAPMTRDETRGAIQTALEMQPATPPPERSITDPIKNFTSDLSDIVKSVPRLPLGLAKEVLDIPNMGKRISENEEAGMNPIAALLNAPGVRLIPGAYVAGNIAQGGKGIKELMTHPLMTGLDLLPAASKLAEGTTVAKLAEEAAVQAGRKPRPLSAVMTGRVLRDDAGNLVQGVVRSPGGFSMPAGIEMPAALGRNALGQTMDAFRENTRLGSALEGFGGKTSRMNSRIRGQYEQRWNGLADARLLPEIDNVPEQLLYDSRDLFKKYEDEYPFLKTTRDAAGPEFDAMRRDFYDTLSRDPDSLNPGLVADLRDFNYRVAKQLESDGKLALFDDEWYAMPDYRQIKVRQDKLANLSQLRFLAGEYRTPSGLLDAPTIDKIKNEIYNSSPALRGNQAHALEVAMDAYGYDISKMHSARANLRGRKSQAEWVVVVDEAMATGPVGPMRRTLDEVVTELRSIGYDGQARRLEDAIKRGDRNGATKMLKSLYERAEPPFDEISNPRLREDARFLSRRNEFDNKIKNQITDAAMQRAEDSFMNQRKKSAPARFDPLIEDITAERITDIGKTKAGIALGRELTAREVDDVTGAVLGNTWAHVPGVDPTEMLDMTNQIRKEVRQTWMDLRAEGYDPVFVHQVSPNRANQALSGNIGPIPVDPSSTKARAGSEYSPALKDIQVSLRHQAGEILQKRYNEQFVDDIISRIGHLESDLRAQLHPEVMARLERYPSTNYEGALERIIRDRYERFNPDEAGFSWGGSRLNKYRQEDFYIPKSAAANLKLYAKPPSTMAAVMDPITKAFRYNVIGLSPSVTLNNFFSNSVTMTAESGIGPLQYFSKAREWLRDPSKIDNAELAALMGAEQPGMEYLTREAWLKRSGALGKSGKARKAIEGRLGFQTGVNAGTAFAESAAIEAVKKGKNALDGVVEKNLQLQRMGDNIHRVMQFMYEREKGIKSGLTKEMSDAAAMEMVRKTFVDYTSFTPIERSAIRTIIPFYSYMGHAARFIMRYPFDHPLRASLVAKIADAERERLGALPGSYLSMIPLPGFLGGGMGEDGKENMLALRPFDPFGDISDLTSVAGWLSATNPVVQTALQQVGVVRGEAELYPTMRYNPDTGRMEAQHGNPLMDLFNNTLPRASVLTSLLGVNPAFNEVVGDDPDAAKRMLVSQLGLPRAWRNVDKYRDMFKGEVNRQKSQAMVQNEALKSGNWTEALRYPALRPMYSALNAADPASLAQYQAASPAEINQMVAEIIAQGG